MSSALVSMPAEWSKHQACIILYPHNKAVFRQDCLRARAEIEQVAMAIVHQGDEDVVFFCRSNEDAVAVSRKFKEQRIHVLVCQSDDTWARDTGPTFVIESKGKGVDTRIRGLDWQFNAYGGPESGSYWPCELDKQIATTICHSLSRMYDIPIHVQSVPMILEGGSIHVDGEGTCLTTAECLLNLNRNPQMTREQIEHTVLSALGCKKMLWLPLGVAFDDDTNGHIDNMACFVKPSEIILSWTDDHKRDPENYDRCRKAREYLEQQTDSLGRSLTIHKLFLPPPLHYNQDEVDSLTTNEETSERRVGERLAASYVNFYIANKAVIVPQFGVEPSDSNALATLQKLFPSRKVVGVASREILLGGGNIHCMTQQIPMIL